MPRPHENSRRQPREHRERLGWGYRQSPESSLVKLMLVWKGATPVPLSDYFARSKESTSRIWTRYSSMIQSIYGVLPSSVVTVREAGKT